jgi:hypothetical protein
MAYRKGDVIAAADLNGFLASVRDIYGVGTGNRGYGQTTVTQSNVVVGANVAASHWTNLRSMIAVCATHQGTSITNLPPSGSFAAGQTIFAHEQAAPSSNTYDLDSYIAAIDTNRLTADAASMTLSTSSFTLTRSGAWSTAITGVFDVDFGSENAARYFFNSGGELRIRLVHPSGGTTKDADWRTLLSNAIGTMTLKAGSFSISGTASAAVSNVGFYSLGSSTPTTVLNGQNLGTGAYSMNDVTVTAKVLNRANVNGGNGTGIRFTVVLDDAYTNAEVAETGLLSGTALHVDVLRATYLSSIGMPTFTTVTSFSASNQAPTWTTASGSLGTNTSGAAVSVQLAATDPEGGALSYALVNGTSLPPGVTLSSSGLLSGNFPIVTTATTYPFSIAVSDGSASSTRNFSFTVNKLNATTTQITTDGDWTVPAGVTEVMFTWVIGGGGAGGTGHTEGDGSGGGGGGSGGWVHYEPVSCTPGDVFSFVIGQGGLDAPGDPPGGTDVGDTASGSTIVSKNGTPVITVTGGSKGQDGRPNSSQAAGGAGGSPNGVSGQGGSVGSGDTSSVSGGNGAAGPLVGSVGGLGGTTAGGAQYSGASTGKVGTGYGSGGGGSGNKDRAESYNWPGGAGNPGFVEFTWPSYGETGGTAAA